MPVGKLIIERLLPEIFLAKLGRYAATCAHIERVMWLIVLRSEQAEVEGRDFASMLAVRRNTTDLIKEFKQATAKFQPGIKLTLDEVAKRIDDGLFNRHLAIHGAWERGPDGTYRVEYFFNEGTKKSPNWKRWVKPLSEDDIDFAVSDANDILAELVSVLQEISAMPEMPEGQ